MSDCKWAAGVVQKIISSNQKYETLFKNFAFDKHNTLYKKVKVLAKIARNMSVLKDIKRACMRIVSCPSLLRNFLETAAFFFFFFSGIDLNRILYYCDMILLNRKIRKFKNMLPVSARYL